MLAFISKALEKGCKVCIPAPTGFLACKFKASFGDEITTDTVHSAFHYTVEEGAVPSINWYLCTPNQVRSHATIQRLLHWTFESTGLWKGLRKMGDAY